MKKIKNYIITAIAGIIIFCVFYFLGCFYEHNFNIAIWNDETRALVCIIGGLCSITIMISIIMNYIINNKNEKN